MQYKLISTIFSCGSGDNRSKEMWRPVLIETEYKIERILQFICSILDTFIFTPVISDMCTGQQMKLAVKTLNP